MIEENNSVQQADMYTRAARREQMFCHTLLTEKRHELLFAPFNISFSQYRILIYLQQRHEGVQPSVIADDLVLLRQTVTNLLDGMAQRGWIERHPHPQDRRRLLIRLLPDGKKLAKQLLKLETEYDLRVDSHFTREELELYYRLRTRRDQARETELQNILLERETK